MRFGDRTEAAESLIADEARAESPLVKYAELIAEFCPKPLGPAIKLFTQVNAKRIENIEYLRRCMLDDLRDLRGVVEQQAAKHEEDRKSTRLNSSHLKLSRMPSSA